MRTLADQLGPYAGTASLIEGAATPEAQAPNFEELAKGRQVAPGRDALLPCAVSWHGPWRKRSDGFAKHTREQVLALASHLAVRLEHAGPASLLNSDVEPEVMREVSYLMNVSAHVYPIAVRQIIFSEAQHVRAALLPPGARIVSHELQDLVLKSTIVYTSWERDRVSPEVIEALEGIADLWVPCQANATAFINSGMDPDHVRVFPYPYEPSTHLTTKLAIPRSNGVVPSGKRFYAIGKWEPRKDYHKLIGAFLMAYTPKDQVSLTIKTFGWGKWKSYPSPTESGNSWATNPAVLANGWTPELINRFIRVIDADLTDQEIADLHRKNNVYVSCSHGEAWDIPAWDALCAGNALVHVGFGGSADYADAVSANLVQRVPWRFGGAHQDYHWEPDAQWAEYRIEDLVAAMRFVEVPAERIHPSQFPRFYGRSVVGEQMMDRILHLLRDLAPAEASKLWAMGTFG